jgi:hypothetical protein
VSSGAGRLRHPGWGSRCGEPCLWSRRVPGSGSGESGCRWVTVGFPSAWSGSCRGAPVAPTGSSTPAGMGGQQSRRLADEQGVFERFNARGRRVVVVARDHARVLGHDHIGTEHLLLGLIDDETSTAMKVLASSGVTPDMVRRGVLARAPRASAPPGARIPLTRRAERALECSMREALKLRDNFVGTEHILLGLIRERRGAAAQVLVELVGPLEVARDAVVRQRAAPLGPEGSGTRD